MTLHLHQLAAMAIALAAATLSPAWVAAKEPQHAEPAPPAAAPSGPLDGTSWTIRATPDDDAAARGETPFTDHLIFGQSTITLGEGVKSGFKPSAYHAWQMSGDVWSFSADQASDREGDISLHGAVLGQDIKGTLLWTKPNGVLSRYSYEGRRAARPR